MTVYIEYVLIDNMSVNTLLLYATFLTLKRKPRPWRVLLSALLGTACAVVLPLVELPPWASVPVKLPIALVMTLIVLPKFRLKDYIMSNLVFLAYTFVLGGAIMGLFYLTGTDFSAMSTLNYAAQVPIGLYIMGIALFCYLVYNVVRFVNDAKRRASFVRKVKLKVDDLTFELSGYVDSGNFLMQDGLPVCFVFDRRVKKHVSEVLAGSLMSTDKHCRERFKTIFFDTVGGKKQKAYAFRPDVFEVDDQAADVYVALGGKNFHGAKPQFDVLLNSVLAEK